MSFLYCIFHQPSWHTKVTKVKMVRLHFKTNLKPQVLDKNWTHFNFVRFISMPLSSKKTVQSSSYYLSSFARAFLSGKYTFTLERQHTSGCIWEHKHCSAASVHKPTCKSLGCACAKSFCRYLSILLFHSTALVLKPPGESSHPNFEILISEGTVVSSYSLAFTIQARLSDVLYVNLLRNATQSSFLYVLTVLWNKKK